MADDAQFVGFVRAHGGSLFRTAYLLTGTSAAAEDLVQDTLTRLYPRWDRVMAADFPLAYVRRSLANGFVSTYRHHKREVLTGYDPVEEWDGRDLSQQVADRDHIAHLLERLPAKQRAAVVMRYLHDMSDEQIAEAIGCRQATVRSLISRAMSAMRAQSERLPVTTTQPWMGQENTR